MEPATWVFGTVVALALFHLLLLGFLGSRRNPNAAAVGGDGGGESSTDPLDEDADEQSSSSPRSRPADAHENADVVRCRECGAENERGYRYCRHCVAELPGASPLQVTGTSPIGGLG